MTYDAETGSIPASTGLSGAQLSHMPQSGTICYCPQCAAAGRDPFFRAWPSQTFCPRHRDVKPRVRVIDGKFVYV
jgi:hypothetical protein